MASTVIYTSGGCDKTGLLKMKTAVMHQKQASGVQKKKSTFRVITCKKLESVLKQKKIEEALPPFKYHDSVSPRKKSKLATGPQNDAVNPDVFEVQDSSVTDLHCQSHNVNKEATKGQPERDHQGIPPPFVTPAEQNASVSGHDGIESSPSLSSGNIDYSPRHFALRALQIGFLKVEWRNESHKFAKAKSKILFGKRKLTYEFKQPLTVSGEFGPQNGAFIQVTIEVKFSAITSLSATDCLVAMEVNSRPHLCCKLKSFDESSSTASLNSIAVQKEFEHHLKTSPYHWLTLADTSGEEFCRLLSQFEGRFSRLLDKNMLVVVEKSLPGNDCPTIKQSDSTQRTQQRTAAPSSPQQPHRCTCLTGCMFTRCGCMKGLQACGPTCRCIQLKNCRNPLTFLEDTGVKDYLSDPCLLDNLHSVQMTVNNLQQLEFLECCNIAVPRYKLIPGVVKCPGKPTCKESYGFSWCGRRLNGKKSISPVVVDGQSAYLRMLENQKIFVPDTLYNSNTYTKFHCEKCQYCTSAREVHCKVCDKCHHVKMKCAGPKEKALQGGKSAVGQGDDDISYVSNATETSIQLEEASIPSVDINNTQIDGQENVVYFPEESVECTVEEVVSDVTEGAVTVASEDDDVAVHDVVCATTEVELCVPSPSSRDPDDVKASSGCETEQNASFVDLDALKTSTGNDSECISSFVNLVALQTSSNNTSSASLINSGVLEISSKASPSVSFIDSDGLNARIENELELAGDVSDAPTDAYGEVLSGNELNEKAAALMEDAVAVAYEDMAESCVREVLYRDCMLNVDTRESQQKPPNIDLMQTQPKQAGDINLDVLLPVPPNIVCSSPAGSQVGSSDVLKKASERKQKVTNNKKAQMNSLFTGAKKTAKKRKISRHPKHTYFLENKPFAQLQKTHAVMLSKKSTALHTQSLLSMKPLAPSVNFVSDVNLPSDAGFASYEFSAREDCIDRSPNETSSISPSLVTESTMAKDSSFEVSCPSLSLNSTDLTCIETVDMYPHMAPNNLFEGQNAEPCEEIDGLFFDGLLSDLFTGCNVEVEHSYSGLL